MATRWLVVGTRQLFRRGVLAYPVPNVVRSRHTARTRITAKMTAETKTFRLALIKPSHYDDDGYVIQWFRSSMPSNSLAAVYGLAVDCAARHVLGAAAGPHRASYPSGGSGALRVGLLPA